MIQFERARPVLALAALAALIPGGPAGAAVPTPGDSFSAVRVDGVALGSELGALRSLAPAIAYDAGTFHLWYATVDDTNNDCTPLPISVYRHASSADGVNFVSDGNLSFAGGDPFASGSPWGAGANSPVGPPVLYPFVARQGGEWRFFSWSCNNQTGGYPPPDFGDFNYSESVASFGASLSSLTLTHLGPVGPAPGNGIFGQTIGCWGLVAGYLYCEDDTLNGGGAVGRAAYADGSPVAPPATAFTGPWAASVSGHVSLKDLITPIPGYSAPASGEGEALAYAHNLGRVIDNGDGTLGLVFGIRDYPTGTRPEKQVYYSESADGGATWSDPVGVFADGNLVTVDGLGSLSGFNPAEFVPLGGGARSLYINLQDENGRWVVAGQPLYEPALTQEIPTLGAGALALLGLLLGGAALLRLRRQTA
jgi:hypothetical protein